MSDFTTAPRDPFVVVTLPTRVDASNTKALVEAVTGSGSKQIILDLKGTEIVDSTALGAIVKVHTSMQTTGGKLVLAGVGDGIRRVLAMTRLDRVFTMVADVDAAVNS
jgi:anti-anti-sigma factor